MNITVSRKIDRPPEDVWRYIAEDHLENHPKWDPGITKLEQKGTGALGVGQKLDLVRKDMGRVIPMELEFTSWDPNRKLGFEVEAKQMHMNASVDLVPEGGATQLTLSVDAEGKGFAKVMMPLMGGRMRKQMTSSTEYIKKAVESGS